MKLALLSALAAVGSLAFATLWLYNDWYTLLVLAVVTFCNFLCLPLEELIASEKMLSASEISDLSMSFGVTASKSGSSVETSGICNNNNNNGDL